jgi:translation initiation factor eIF-2B subunit alpha
LHTSLVNYKVLGYKRFFLLIPTIIDIYNCLFIYYILPIVVMDVGAKNKSSHLFSTEKFIPLVNEFKSQLLNSTTSKVNMNKQNTISFHHQHVDPNSVTNKHPHLQVQNREELINAQKVKASNENIIEAFIKSISKFIGEDNTEITLQGLNKSIKNASEFLFVTISQEHLISEGRSTITLKAVSEIIIHLINKHISRNLKEDFSSIKNSIVKLCDDLVLICEGSKKKISKFFKNAMRNGMTIMVHGFSTTVFNAIVDCKNSGINLNVLISDCSPEHSGNIMHKALNDQSIKSHVISDLSIGYYMKDIDCIVVGSNALVENGGVINRIGSYTLAICAKSFKKPFYVLSECLKFLKLYPLEQSDIPFNSKGSDIKCKFGELIDMKKNSVFSNKENKKDDSIYDDYICDYTPPEFINLIFTDIGIFTPSAVSDELIQMFYN